ncbi:MAG: transposase [bacterium]|nr:transposase [bacterium]
MPGFSLHANTQVPAHRRDQLERLLRYTARGARARERLHQDANGDLVYRFTHPWSDGTTGIKLSPLELLEKLSALLSPPPSWRGMCRSIAATSLEPLSA